MADLQAAIDYALQGNDGTIASAEDGKRIRFGIDEHFHPELSNCLFYSSMGKVAALQIARGIYEVSYCEPLCIAEMSSQAIAHKVLSLSAHVGVTAAGRMLQEAVTVVGDGRIGPLTLYALDMSEETVVVERLRDCFQERLRESPELVRWRGAVSV